VPSSSAAYLFAVQSVPALRCAMLGDRKAENAGDGAHISAAVAAQLALTAVTSAASITVAVARKGGETQRQPTPTMCREQIPMLFQRFLRWSRWGVPLK